MASEDSDSTKMLLSSPNVIPYAVGGVIGGLLGLVVVIAVVIIVALMVTKKRQSEKGSSTSVGDPQGYHNAMYDGKLLYDMTCLCRQHMYTCFLFMQSVTHKNYC